MSFLVGSADKPVASVFRKPNMCFVRSSIWAGTVPQDSEKTDWVWHSFPTVFLSMRTVDNFRIDSSMSKDGSGALTGDEKVYANFGPGDTDEQYWIKGAPPGFYTSGGYGYPSCLLSPRYGTVENQPGPDGKIWLMKKGTWRITFQECWLNPDLGSMVLGLDPYGEPIMLSYLPATLGVWLLPFRQFLGGAQTDGIWGEVAVEVTLNGGDNDITIDVPVIATGEWFGRLVLILTGINSYTMIPEYGVTPIPNGMDIFRFQATGVCNPRDGQTGDGE